jgi:hypothetical protein
MATAVRFVLPDLPWGKLRAVDQTAIKHLLGIEGRETFWDDKKFQKRTLNGNYHRYYGSS